MAVMSYYAIRQELVPTKYGGKIFTDFNEDEIDLLFRLYVKLFTGIERVEKYAEKLG